MVSKKRNNLSWEAGYLMFIKRYYFIVLLIITVTQQIYMPQHYQYMHLALLFVYITFLDLFKGNSFKLICDIGFALSIALCVGISIAEHVLSVDLSVFYLLSLVIASIFALYMTMTLVRILGHKELWHYLKPVHAEATENRRKFLRILISSLSVMIVFAVFYVIYTIIMS